MSWLTDFVRPRIKKLLVKRDIPDNLWSRCTGCEQMVFSRDLQNNLFVCKHCDHHFYLPPEARAKMLFDDGHYRSLSFSSPPEDPLNFKDTKRYKDRLKDLKKTGRDAVFLAQGLVKTHPLIAAIFDFKCIGGSMGTAAGEALLEGAAQSLKKKIPYLIVSASGGARMQEGILSLMQMPRSLVGIRRLREAGIPFISLLTYPTTGGVSASFASVGDLNFAEPGALIGFTGARVIKQNLRTPLPEGFQTATFQLDHGALDGIIHRHQWRETLSRVLSCLNKPS